MASASFCNHSDFNDQSVYNTCSVCAHLFRISHFVRKPKNSFFIDRISCFDFKDRRDYLKQLDKFVSYAEGVTHRSIGCQFDSPFSAMSGSRTEDRSPDHSCYVCFDARHIFECVSASHQARGKLFPVHREGYCWYATCEACSACCEFTPTAALTPLLVLFKYLDFKKVEDGVEVMLKGESRGRIMNKSTLLTMEYILDRDIDFDENTPIIASIDKGFPKLEVIEDLEYEPEYAKCMPSNDVTGGCDVRRGPHVFHIWCREKHFDLPFTLGMERMFFMLMRGSGYLFGKMPHFGHGAILSVMDMQGIHVRCNTRFVEAHEHFFSGADRGPRPEQGSLKSYEAMGIRIGQILYTCNGLDITPLINSVAQSGTSSDDDYEHVPDINDLMARVDEFPNVEVVDIRQAFLDDDSPLVYEEEEVARTQGRGLRQKVGGFLRAVSKCVTKLHAVWDWPLDKALKAVDDTGAWMEQNKEFVRDDVWSCTMCDQLRKDMQAGLKEHNDVLELLQKGVEKLAKAVDDSNELHAKYTKDLKDEIKVLKGKVEDLANRPTVATGTVKVEMPPPTRFSRSDPLPGEQRAIPRGAVKTGRELTEAEVRYCLEPFDEKKVNEQIAWAANVDVSRVKTAEDRLKFFREYMSKHSGDRIEEAETSIVESVVESSLQRTINNDLHNLMFHNFLIRSFTWDVKDGENVVLAKIDMPEALVNENARMKDIMGYFQYYTCDGFEFEITTTSLAMQGGTLLVAWDSMSSAIRQGMDSMVQLSGLPNVRVHASSDSNVKFKVECSAIHEMLCLSGSEDVAARFGTLIISCANVLNVPAGASESVNVNIWAKFLNPKLHFPTRKHQIVLKQVSSGSEGEFRLGELEAVVARGTWSTTSDINLLELNVHPCACYVEGGLVYQTPLSVVSHLYSRWRGELIYRIIFGASLFAKGRIRVCAIPVQFRQKKLSAEEMSAFPSEIFDLSSGKREFDFTVPYYSVGTTSMVCRDVLYDVACYDSRFVVSRLHFLILDPLLLNANASNQISYIVTQRPGRSFTLSEPTGVKGEFVERVFAQDFNNFIKGSEVAHSVMKGLIDSPSVLLRVELSADKKECLGIQVSPCLRGQPPCSTILSWLGQIFTQWNGGLIYTLRAHSFDKTKACFVKLWHDVNGSTTNEDGEFEYYTDVVSPAGQHVLIWEPAMGSVSFEVPFKARTPKLLVPKTLYPASPYAWLQCYNGLLMMDYEGEQHLKIEISIAGATDFEFYDRSVAPKCGRVSDAFTKLTFADKLLSADAVPIYNRERLSGPTKKAKAIKVGLKPVDEVDDEGRKGSVEPRSSSRTPRVYLQDDDHTDAEEGDFLRIGKEYYVLRDEDWILINSAKQMNTCVASCIGMDVKGFNDTVAVFEAKETCMKVADIVDLTHAAVMSDEMTKLKADLPGLMEEVGKINELLKGVNEMKDTVDGGLSFLANIRKKLMACIIPIIKSTIPGLVYSCIDNEQYAWATVATIFGICLMAYACKNVKKMKKKVAVLCMIIWSPFMIDCVWSLGKWISGKFLTSTFSTLQATCRKHSKAGAAESLKEGAKSIFSFIGDNWLAHLEGILSLFGVITSLVMWGSVPDEKKLTGFAAKFKAAGEKGKTISMLSSGLKSAVTMSKDIAKWITEWCLGLFGSNLPKAESELQKMLNFSLKEWVLEVREFSLLENKFNDFGSLAHVEKTRRLYDKSIQIQKALLTEVKVDVQLSMIVKECREKCTELMNDSYAYKGMKKSRIDPIHICVSGKPGVGKSAAAHMIIDDLLDAMDEPVTDRIFTRCCADAYWSNYHQEPVILYDDLGAIDSNMRISDFAEIMGIKSNDPFAVPMAAVEEKGKHCLSKYVFSCTNLKLIGDNCDVVTKGAFYRRRNVMVEVDCDPNVPKDPTDPSKGLLFTVLATVEEGARRNNYVVKLKDTWDEHFLKDVEGKEAWVFDRVDYSTFLKFLIEYSKAYMENQATLVNTLNSTPEERKQRRLPTYDETMMIHRQTLEGEARASGSKSDDDSEEGGDDVQPNASKHMCTKPPDICVSLRQMIMHFDKSMFPAKEIYDGFKRAGITAPKGMNSKKVLSFLDLVYTYCECSNEHCCESCTYWMNDFNAKNMAVMRTCDHHSIALGLRMKKVSSNCMETEFVIKKGLCLEQLFEGKSPVSSFCALLAYLHWDSTLVYHAICPYRAFGVEASSKKRIVDDSEFDYDDIITKKVCLKNDNGIRFAEWKGLGFFYPEHSREFKCLGLVDHHGKIVVFKRVEDSGVAQPLSSAKKLYEFEPRMYYPKQLFAEEFDRQLLNSYLDALPTFGLTEEGKIPEQNVEFFEQAEQNLKGHLYIIFLLCYAEESANRRNLSEIVAKETKTKVRMDDVLARYKEYEKQVCGGLSKKMKIGLAIAGGFVIAGTTIAIIFGIKKGVDAIVGLVSDCTAPTKTDEVTQSREPYVVEVVDLKEMVEESAVQDLGEYSTNLQLTTSLLQTEAAKKQNAPSDESERIKTERKKNGLSPPKAKGWFVSSKARKHVQSGMGVAYSEKVRVSVPKKEEIAPRYKVPPAQKQLYETAVKHFKKYLSEGKMEDLGSILREIEKWQNVITEKGVARIADNEERNKLAASLILDQLGNEIDKEKEDGGLLLLSTNETIPHDSDLKVAQMLGSNNLTKDVVSDMLHGNTTMMVNKQIRIGSVGVERDMQAQTLLSTHGLKMSCTIFNCTQNKQCMVVRLVGSIILCPAHYIDEFEEDDEIYFISAHKVTLVKADPKRMRLLNKFQDLVIWDLGKSVPPSKSYIDHIPTVKDWEHYRNGQGLMCFSKYDPTAIVQTVHFLSDVERIAANVEVPTATYLTYGALHSVVCGLRYKVSCVAGFCGAIIIRADSRLTRKIVGMHVAGSSDSGVGYGEMLVREFIVDAINELDHDMSRAISGDNVEVPLVPNAEKQCNVQGFGNLGVVGAVDQNLLPRIPLKTTVMKSPIHGLFGKVLTQPSILSPFDRRLGEKRGIWDPIIDSACKYGINIKLFSDERVQDVEDFLVSHFRNKENSLKKREVNDVEVGINGIDRSDYWLPIEMKTSAGYPHIIKKPKDGIGKLWLFEKEGEYPSGREKYLMKENEMKESYVKHIKDIHEGRVPSFTTIECPKDERRKLSKIFDTPATRTFTILPCEINIIFRMYFGDFAAMVMSNRHTSFCQVGIDPNTMEWSELMTKFKSVGQFGFAGDYAKFDGIGPSQIYHSIVNVVNAWYDDGKENARARHCLVSSIIHRFGLVGEWLLQYSQGMPSGFAMTVIFNSMVNYYFMALAWMDIVEKSPLSHQADLESFSSYTKLVTFGDDNVVAVSPYFQDFYNLRTVAAFLSEYGITYTDDAKNPIHMSETVVPIESVTFLKRGFVKVDKAGLLWKAPLSKLSIEEQCHWIRQIEVPVEALQQNVFGALFEASIHGEEYFDDFYGRLKDAFDRVMIPFEFHGYMFYTRRWWSNMTGACLPQESLRDLVVKASLNSIDLSREYLNLETRSKVPLKELLAKAIYAPLVEYEV
uniref:Genome polyprotein n=1 Tax=Pagoda dogwood waikavirus TaxID=3115792 RepID=A0AAT9JAZ8_9SECO